MVEGKDYEKIFNAKLEQKSKRLPNETRDNYIFRSMDACIAQQLQLSRHLHMKTQEEFQRTNVAHVIYVFMDKLTDTIIKSDVLQANRIPGYMHTAMPTLKQDIDRLDHSCQGCFILSMPDPEQPTIHFHRYVVFHKDLCDKLPSLPRKYVPTISEQTKANQKITRTICSFRSCGNPRAKNRCAVCKTVRYCDQTCQAEDWKEHKKICKPYNEKNMYGVVFGQK